MVQLEGSSWNQTMSSSMVLAFLMDFLFPFLGFFIFFILKKGPKHIHLYLLKIKIKIHNHLCPFFVLKLVFMKLN